LFVFGKLLFHRIITNSGYWGRKLRFFYFVSRRQLGCFYKLLSLIAVVIKS